MRALVGISLSPRYRVGDHAEVTTIYCDEIYDRKASEPDVEVCWFAVLANGNSEVLSEKGRKIIIPTGVGGKRLRATASIRRTRTHDAQELSAETEYTVHHPIPVVASIQLIRVEESEIITDTDNIMIGDKLSFRYQLVDGKISEGIPRIKWFRQGVECTSNNNQIYFTASDEDLHHPIQVQLTVTSVDDFPGIPVISTSGLVKPLSPVLDNVTISGVLRSGKTLSLNYEGRSVSILYDIIPDHFIEWKSSKANRISSGYSFDLLTSDVGSSISVTICVPEGVICHSGDRLTSKPIGPVQRSPVFDPENPIEDITVHITDLPYNCKKQDLRWLTRLNNSSSWSIAAVGSVFTPTVNDIGKQIKVISDVTREVLAEAQSEVAAHPSRIKGSFTVGDFIQMESSSEMVWQRKLPKDNNYCDISSNETILLLPEDEGYEVRLVCLSPMRFLFPERVVSAAPTTRISSDGESPLPTLSVVIESGPFCWFVGSTVFGWSTLSQAESFKPSVDYILQSVTVCRLSSLPPDRCFPDLQFGSFRLLCPPQIVRELETLVMKGISGHACQLNKDKVIVVLSSSGIKISSLSTEKVIQKLEWESSEVLSTQSGEVTIRSGSSDVHLILLSGLSEMFLLIFRLFQALSTDPIVPLAVSHPWRKGLTRPGKKCNTSKVLELSTFIKSKQSPRHLIPEVGNPVRNTLLGVIMRS